MNNSFIDEEKKKLDNTKKEIENILSEEKARLESLPKLYAHDPRLLSNLMGLISTKINNIISSNFKPYFARIDFKSDTEKNDEVLYIGKVGMLSQKGDILITDWRAPVSTLYYDSNLGHVSYIAPEGQIDGELKLKRQILIENGELVSIFDVDAVSDDELLKPFLGANADGRLKNIIASIQSEQNAIIRSSIGDNIIIQGVAGSGKTTVALHKIAYLVYNYSKLYKASQYMVIGPNKFFINYISNVLPDLDVGNAEQYTFEDLAKVFIGEEFNVCNSSDTLINTVSGNFIPTYHSFKMSIGYKEAIDKFINEYFEIFLPNEGLVVNGFTVLKKSEILCELNENNQSDIATKVDVVVKRFASRLKENDKKYQEIKKYFNEIESRSNYDKRSQIIKLMMDTNKQLDTGFIKALKKYLNIKNVKIIGLYKYFIENIEKYCDQDFSVTLPLKTDTLKNIKNSTVQFEDLAALIYLKLRLKGSGNYKEFVHVVIDEAQDFGVFNFYVLKRLFNKSTFSIFGDLTQGIYSYRAINNWHEVNDIVFNGKAKVQNLEKSYRTTIEIMQSANLISEYLGLGSGKPVIRHGDQVKAVKLNKNEKVEYVYNYIKECQNNGFSSIAIICKTHEQSKKIYEHLTIKGIKLDLIEDDNEKYNSGVCILPSHLSKGLEFDAVLVCDCDENNYSSKSKLDMKLLYVAMTRALHRLVMTYSNKITLPLRKLYNK